MIALLFAIPAAYQFFALIACIAHLRRKERASSSRPPVSILKPVYGADDHFWSAIVSHAHLQYPVFEILFAVRDRSDTALPFIERLQREFPQVEIRIVWTTTQAPNAKAGALADLARAARYDVLVANDSDIVVEPNYLDVVTAPLEDARTGLVTCLYRAGASNLPTEWEALGIATDFAPSALVAPLVGVNEFGMGSTLALRRAELDACGGFEAVGPYIADDYQVGKNISAMGKRVHLSRMAVETHLGAGTWKSVWEHQSRWARTIRVSRSGYFGLPITNGSLWAFVALVVGAWWWALALIALRLTVGLTCGVGVLYDPITARLWWLMPLRDLWGFAIWVRGALPGTVIWRGKRLTLDREGRIIA